MNSVGSGVDSSSRDGGGSGEPHTTPARIRIEGPDGSAKSGGPWDSLERIHDVELLSDADLAVLADVREVLEKHRALERFGVTLLHSHFDVSANEVLVERVDADARSMAISTEPLATFDAVELVPTAWRYVADRLVATQYCYRPKGSDFHMR